MSSRYAEDVRFLLTWRKLKEIKRKICIILSICHVTCIPSINFHNGSIHTVIRWYANFCQKVKRYQNHLQRNARSLQCYSFVKCFRKLRNSKIWPNLYVMFFLLQAVWEYCIDITCISSIGILNLLKEYCFMCQKDVDESLTPLGFKKVTIERFFWWLFCTW